MDSGQPNVERLGRIPGRPAEIAPDTVARFSVVSVGDDYLTCHPVDSTGNVNTSVTTYVLKPPLCQNRLAANPRYDPVLAANVTYTYVSGGTRTAVSGSTTETQYITPSYSAGDLIGACLWAGDIQLSNSAWTRWQDRNLDGRQWATPS
jgi:hypothetical protein